MQADANTVSKTISIPISEALACVHYHIEQNNLEDAKGILRVLIRQAVAMETEQAGEQATP